MQYIRLKTKFGVYQAGDVISTLESVADTLIKSGHAEKAEGTVIRTATNEPPENTALKGLKRTKRTK